MKMKWTRNKRSETKNYIQQTIWLDIQFITIQTDIDLAIAIEFSVHPLARF